jgi:hypothetical protein
VGLVVLLEGRDLGCRVGGEHERDIGVDGVGIGLHCAAVGRIARATDNSRLGWRGAEDLFLALEEQAIAGPVLQVDACDVHFEQILHQLLL